MIGLDTNVIVRYLAQDDARQAVPVADEIGKDAHKERLLDEARDDVLVRSPTPEQRGERYVDRGKGCC